MFAIEGRLFVLLFDEKDMNLKAGTKFGLKRKFNGSFFFLSETLKRTQKSIDFVFCQSE